MSFSLIPDIPYTSARDTRCRYDLYLPDGTDTCPLIIYFYGGSLKKGAKEGNRLARAAVEAGYAVAVPDYRLIPEVSYPAFIEDAADAVCAVMRGMEQYTDRVSRIFVGGHSAGAYLSMMLAFDRHYLDVRGIDRSKIAGWLFISGQPTTHFSVLESRGMDKRAVIIDDTAALWYVRSDVGEPALIVTCDADLACRREQNYLLLATLKRFGYTSLLRFADIQNCSHGGLVKPDENGKVPVMPHIIDFISEVCGGENT